MGARERNRIRNERRAKQREKADMARRAAKLAALGDQGAPVNVDALAPFNSYGVPEFVARGYYQDIAFCCKACGREEVWRATQQKWWYEVAKGHASATAVRCRSCRKLERARIERARADSDAGRRMKAMKRGSK